MIKRYLNIIKYRLMGVKMTPTDFKKEITEFSEFEWELYFSSTNAGLFYNLSKYRPFSSATNMILGIR